MKRLFYYIPECMLAAGLLLAAGILLACKCPRPAAPIIGPDIYLLPEVKWYHGPKCPNGMALWASTHTLTGAPESACVDSRSDAAELYGKWMQLGPTVTSCDAQIANLMVPCK